MLEASQQTAPCKHLQLQLCAQWTSGAWLRTMSSSSKFHHYHSCCRELFHMSRMERTPNACCAWHHHGSIHWEAVTLRPSILRVSVAQKKRPSTSQMPATGKGVVGKHAQQGPPHRKPAQTADANSLHLRPGKKRSARSHDPDVVSTLACCLLASGSPLICPDVNSIAGA